MNLKSILAAIAVALCVPCGHADDKLVSIDAANDLITVDQRGTLKSFRAKKFTEVTLNGAKAAIDQLRPGMMVTFVLSDPQTVSKITARGNPGQPTAATTPTVTPGAAKVPTGTARRLTIKLYVDGSDVIKVGGGRLWIEHATAKKPTGISVNGINWEPTWKGNTSEVFTGFAPGLAPFTGKVSVKQTTGRGETTVVEPPTSENQQTLSFRIQDGGSGGNVHEVRVTW